MTPKRLIAAGLGVALAATVGLAPVASADAPTTFTIPKPTGPYRTGTTELHLVDSSREDPWVPGKRRELMVSVTYPAARVQGYERAAWMPAAAAAHFDQNTSPGFGIEPGTIDWAGTRAWSRVGAPALPGKRPVVVFSPGFGVPRTLGTVLVEELASRGYVVVSIDHTHDASEVEFPGGRVEVGAVPDLTTDVLKKVQATRIADNRYVLDQLAVLRRGGNADAEQRTLPRGLGRSMDLFRVGMFGHSAGGIAAAQTMDEDRRVDAGINLDGTFAWDAGNDLMPVAQTGVRRPFLLFGAGATTHLAHQSWKAFYENSTGWKLDLNVPAGEHFTFTDTIAVMPQLVAKGVVSPQIAEQLNGTVRYPARVLASERVYVTAFFDQHLRDIPRPVLWGQSPRHPDVEFVR
ncbi:alpha/beta hydrolase family protein [Tenggerimyces flavus]|uniref:Alpha/beta hydrolase family protein n=1 Tax=Tenggerimyces flavus TaxID=1708749 RepID=A0ABV7Y5P8_9ACTN|nr:alpha/beta hydrolase [Tenggerimyces flavus]MBM7788318.1 dienelactone hydrolase [Tenggerimyces flavus]